MRPVLIVGGAPRVAVDAVRYLSVRASGATAVALAGRLAGRGVPCDLLLAEDAAPEAQARRYRDREGLERGLAGWIADHPEGVVVLSAAINDYRVSQVERRVGPTSSLHTPGDKVPSGADEVVIRLVPTGKVVDQLRPLFGLRGPLVAFKFEAAETVLASAESLRRRVHADLVVANSLCGTVQALVDASGTHPATDRADLIERLAERLATLSARP